MKQYNLVVCGGSFDHFHKGHEEFLNFVLRSGDKIIIGLTSNAYLKKAEKEQRESLEEYDVRKKSLDNFFEKKAVAERVKIIPINDVFGPLVLKEKRIEAVIVSEQTVKGAEIINNERKKKNLKKLNIIVFPLVFAEDGKIISSSRIRKGEINRSGKAYRNPLWLSKNLFITQNLRRRLSKPFGCLVGEENLNYTKLDPFKSITVGDVVTKVFNRRGVGQMISVVDFLVQREKKFSKLKDLGFLEKEQVVKVNNSSGSLTPQLFRVIFDICFNQRRKIVILIKGEEDLSVLPLVLAAPLGFVVFYGQPKDKGIVRVNITEQKKEEAYRIIDQFE